MFGLVKASKLRETEAKLEASEGWVEEWRYQALNWRALAESRLVAVLLLRDRWQQLIWLDR